MNYLSTIKNLWNKCGENTKLALSLIPAAILFWALLGVFGETVRIGLYWIIFIGCIIFTILWCIFVLPKMIKDIRRDFNSNK